MSDRDDSPEADEGLIEQLEMALTAARSGRMRGIVAVCFMKSDVNVLVAGEQSLVLRLGALEIARDGVRVFEAQKQAKKQPVSWGPPGRA